MGDIYREASEVIIFLGGGPGRQMKGSKDHEDPGPSLAFTNTPSDDNLTSQILSNWTTPGQQQEITSLDIFCLLRILARPHNPSNPFEPLKGVPDDHLTNMFEELRQMLTTRWWDRIWVVQEAVLAQTISLRYGRVSLPWAMVADAALSHLQGSSLQHTGPVSRDDAKVLNLLSRVRDIDTFRQTWRQDNKPKILSLLREFSSRKASDERDKVYGLLGLCDRNTRIWPDYSLEVGETYKMATVDIILNNGSLSVLAGDIGRKDRRDLPSWVPDWSATFDEHDRRRIRFSKNYNACGNVRCCMEETEWTESHVHDEMVSLATNLEHASDVRSLLPFCLLDALVWLRSSRRGFESVCDRLLKHCNEHGQRNIKTLIDHGLIEYEPRGWEGCLGMSGNPVAIVERTMQPVYSSSDMDAVSDAIISWYHTAEDLLRLSGMEFDGTRKAEFISTILSDVKRTTNGFKRLEKDDEWILSYWFQERIERVAPDWPHHGSVKPTPETLDAFTEVVRLSVTNRTFFMTQDSKMGLGPTSIAKWDEIYILPGGRLPFVLRDVECPADVGPLFRDPGLQVFNLVGDCFLHGAMDGQRGFPQQGSLPRRVLDRTLQRMRSVHRISADKPGGFNDFFESAGEAGVDLRAALEALDQSYIYLV